MPRSSALLFDHPDSSAWLIGLFEGCAHRLGPNGCEPQIGDHHQSGNDHEGVGQTQHRPSQAPKITGTAPTASRLAEEAQPNPVPRNKVGYTSGA